MKNKNGFTLVEMIAVIVLIAVLSVVAVSTYRGINESSKKKTLEAKIEQITSAAEKWGRENNITTYKKISVNTLVVEGYITADEVSTDGLAMLKNPVTGENMICNTIELTFKEGVIQSKYNASEQDCKLASQSEVDSNIDIRVFSASGKNLTANGSGSIAKWTNEDVAIIVNSDAYDAKATSISYDFEGNTTIKSKDTLTKYTGSGFVDEGAAQNYYNVFFIKSELLLNTNIVVTYDIPGEGTKSRFYTIRFDKEEATAILKSNSEWLTSKSKAKVIVDDGKGSGPSAIYISRNADDENPTRKPANPSVDLEGLDVGRYYIWTEDNVGNKSQKFKMILEINNIDDFEPSCEVYFDGILGDNGWYKEKPVTPKARMLEDAGASGVNIGVNDKPNTPEYSAFAAAGTTIEATGDPREEDTSKTGVNYYCHVKTIAGNYDKASRNLKLDMTPPTVTINITEDTNYTQEKVITATLADDLSGVPGRFNYRAGWSKSMDCANTSYTEHVIGGRIGDDSYDFYIYGPHEWYQEATGSYAPMTGKYYLCIEYSNIVDAAGNRATAVNGRGTGGKAIFGPYFFDNTPPVCGTDNGKTNWTKGTLPFVKNCLDNKDTEDQSGCTSPTFTHLYTILNTVKEDTITIEDKVGLTTVCPINVYIDNTLPVCDGVGGKTNWTKGTYEVSQNCSESNVTQSGCSSATFTKNYGNTQTVQTDTVDISDNVGNIRTCPINVYIDNTPPVCGASSGDSATWTNQSRTVTVDCQDAHSGCSQPTFSKTYNTDKEYDTIDITDNVGNVTTCTDNNNQGFYFRVDKTPPSCILRNAWGECSVNGPSILIDCEDPVVDGGSGMRSVADGGSLASIGGDKDLYRMSERVSNLTEDTDFYAYDVAGNSERVPIKIDSYPRYRKRTCATGKRCPDAGCSEYNSCVNSVCGAAYCTDGDCCGWDYGAGACYGDKQDGMSCLQITPNTLTNECNYIGAYWCTPKTAKSCTKSCCGWASCPNSSCTCKTYNSSIPTCGCDTWNDYNDWTYASQDCTGAGANSCEIDTETVYSYTKDACHD